MILTNLINSTGLAVVDDFSGDFDILFMLLAGILVFFMQAGFTLLESGMTRSKNSGNIAMKNFMDISVATITFWAVGYGFVYGGDKILGGFLSNGGIWMNEGLGAHDVFFQTVFAATAATIVSGAIAGRAKYSTYIIFTVALTAIIYPISAGWQWYGDGAFLADLGFIDFAGSSIVHSVGGWAAICAAWMIGPRIGKYNADGSVNAIPGGNLLLAALGVFILWLGWFGFNGGSELAFGGDSSLATAEIIMVTNIAAAAGAVGALFTSWWYLGKPSLSQTLNGAVAGLVAITAGCSNFSMEGGLLAGLIGGIIVVFSIEFIEKTLKIDDAIGAASAHGVVGVWGTLVIGLWGVADSAGVEKDMSGIGIFNGGGFEQFLVQLAGVGLYAAWAIGTSLLVLYLLKITIGLRVSEEDEKLGLDESEHGEKAYGSDLTA